MAFEKDCRSATRANLTWIFYFVTPLLSPQVAILDFGSQYSHLIARRVRELHVYCELYSCLVTAEELGKHKLTAIILSGGPNSVYDEGSPHVSEGVWKLIKERSIPVLGICYGMQELAHTFGGEVAPGLKHEYGKSMVQRVEGCDSPLFEGMPQEFQMWMSHGDKLTKSPEGFKFVGTFAQTTFWNVTSVISYIIYNCSNGVSIHSSHGKC